MKTILQQRPYSIPELAFRYVSYYVKAGNGKGHGIHSPFVYAFIREVLNDSKHYYSYDQVEALRQELLKDKTLLEVLDLGAGSTSSNRSARTVSSITRTAAKSPKLARLLFRVVNYFQPQTMIELGTSMGLTSACLAAGNSGATLHTIEGAPAIAVRAEKNFENLGISNIHLVTGNFDTELPALLNRINKPDLSYIDGNHRYEPTLSYFKQLMEAGHEYSIIIMDDIHWSPQMEKAWERIKQTAGVTCTIDLFFLGFVFFRPEFKQPQHFVIRF